MTNYEKICAYINAWHYAVWEHGKYKFTYSEASIRSLDKDWVNNINFTRIYPLPRPIPQYKVGDKVVILENIKEFEVWRHFTVGEVCIVMNSKLDDGTLCIWKVDSTSSWYVLPHCVAPYFDDEAEEMTVEQVCKALGKNIKIVE